MKTIKSAQFRDPRRDFSDVGIRRLMGALSDHAESAQTAFEMLNSYLNDENYHIGLQDLTANGDLRRHLEFIFGHDWEKIVTGSLI
jgi:hypothetical protein